MLRVCVTNLSLSCLVWCPRVVPHMWHVVLPNFVNFGFVPMPKCWQGGPFCPSSSFWNQSLVKKTYATTLARTSCASATFFFGPLISKYSCSICSDTDTHHHTHAHLTHTRYTNKPTILRQRTHLRDTRRSPDSERGGHVTWPLWHIYARGN